MTATGVECRKFWVVSAIIIILNLVNAVETIVDGKIFKGGKHLRKYSTLTPFTDLF